MTRIWQQAARLRKAAVPGWLTEIMPSWLVTAVRPKPAPVPWGQMLRAAIAICVPLAVGLALGDRVLGLLIAIGGLLGSVVDNGSGAYAYRLRRVGSAAVFGGAAGLTIGSLIHGHGWIAVAVLVVVAGISALLSGFSDIGSVTGLQLLVYSSLGLGAFGALRPVWHTALGFVLGTAWALLLTVPSWLLSPRSAERHSVAAVYYALAGELRAVGTPGSAAARLAATATMNAAYDTLLTARSTAGGRNQRMNRLMVILNHANLIDEAATTLSLEGNRPPPDVIDTLDSLAYAITADAEPPVMPPAPATSPGMIALSDSLAGLTRVLSRNWAPPTVQPTPRPPLRERLGALGDRLSGRLIRTFALRLMVCVGVAGVVSEVLPLQRSYWVVLTVAIVLKPDLGSVFARAVQRGLGTVVGAVLGAVIIVVVPYGPWLLLPFAALAALLPYGRSRNFGLLATFLTPLVVVLIDLLAPGGWQLAEDRLIDTLLGCAIVLLIGYAPWPASWQAHLPGQFAATIRCVSRYLQEALVTAPGQPGAAPAAGSDGAARPTRPAATRLPTGSRLRRKARRAISDLRAEFDPVILDRVTPDMLVWREETFGPVLPVMSFADEAEAVRLSNDTGYGLCASVFTADAARAMRVAGALEAGGVSVNNVNMSEGNPGLPFGGVKQSGFGRLRGPEGLLGFTASKAILIDKAGPKIEANWYPYTEEKLRRFNRFIDALYTARRPRLPAIAWHGLGLERFSQKPRR